MNNLKNFFGFSVSRNVCPKTIQGINQTEKLLTTNFYESKLVKNVNSDPSFLNLGKNCVSKCEGNLLKKSNKTRTMYGGPRKSLSLERNSSLDSLSYINNGFQVAGFKNINSRFNRANKEKEIKKSLKDNGNKIPKKNLANKEAQSYAKFIANYSRAMESDSICTRSLERSFGRTGLSITDSPFNSIVPPLSKMKQAKEAKADSILNTRNSSSPKYRRVRDIHSADMDKNGNRNSFYSTNSYTYQETAKTAHMFVTDIKHVKTEREKCDSQNDDKFYVKDMLHSVSERSEWLNNIIKAHKKLKKQNINQDIKLVTPKTEDEKTAINCKKDQYQDLYKVGTEKSDLNNSNFTSLTEISAQCSMEPFLLSNLLKSSSKQDNFTKQSKAHTNNATENPSKSGAQLAEQKSENSQKKSSFRKENIIPSAKSEIKKDDRDFNTSRKSATFSQDPDNPLGSGNSDVNALYRTDSSSPLSCINFRINGKPSSEFLATNGEIKIVSSSSAEKIEIRIPFSTLFPENKNNEDQLNKLQKSESTLSLQISAKIETQTEKHKEEPGAKLLNDEKSESKKKNIVHSPERTETLKENSNAKNNKTNVKKKMATAEISVPKFLKEASLVPCGSVKFPVKEIKSEIKQENNVKRNLSTTGENSALMKKVAEAAVSVESRNATKPIFKNVEISLSKKSIKRSSTEALKKCRVQKDEKVDNNLTEEISAKNAVGLDAHKMKIRRRKKGTTVISRVIVNELEKQNEQVLKDKKVTTTLTTETKKNLPAAEAVKHETKRLGQEYSTIDKVTKKIDAVIDQNVAKKLNDSVTVTGEKVQEDKKGLDTSPLRLLKTKLKNQTPEEQSSKKTVDATSAIVGKHIETKEQTEATKLHHSAKFLTKHQTKQRMNNLDSQSLGKLQVESSNSRKKMEPPKEITAVAHIEILKKKRDSIGKKDIPLELKPLEKKKDGTLIDYGLKVPTRKNAVKDSQTSNLLVSKEQLPAVAKIKEVLTLKEKDIFKREEKNNTKVNSDVTLLKSLKAEFPQTQKEPQFTNGTKKTDKIAPNPPPPKSKDFLSAATASFPTTVDQKSKFIDFKMELQLQEFEEDHIFSAPKRHLHSKNFEKTGVLKSSTATMKKKNSTVKPDNKGSHAKTTGSLVISDTSKVSVQIDDCSQNQSTSKINSLKKNCLKLSSKSSQYSSTKSASQVERLVKTSLNSPHFDDSRISKPRRSSSTSKQRFQCSGKDLLYANWPQSYNNKLKTASTD